MTGCNCLVGTSLNSSLQKSVNNWSQQSTDAILSLLMPLKVVVFYLFIFLSEMAKWSVGIKFLPVHKFCDLSSILKTHISVERER